MISFTDWLLVKEGSPLTRSRKAAADGTGPLIAGGGSRSTPSPYEFESLTKKLKASHKKKKRKKKVKK